MDRVFTVYIRYVTLQNKNTVPRYSVSDHCGQMDQAPGSHDALKAMSVAMTQSKIITIVLAVPPDCASHDSHSSPFPLPLGK